MDKILKPETAKRKSEYIIEHLLYPHFLIGDEFDEYACKQVAKILIYEIIKEIDSQIKHKEVVNWEQERINYWEKVMIEIINYEC